MHGLSKLDRPYQPAKVDWDKVYQAAKREGKVVIYTSSSRTISLKSEFESLYPGVTMEVYELGTTGAIEKVERGTISRRIQCRHAFCLRLCGPTPSPLQQEHVVPVLPARAQIRDPAGISRALVAQRYESRTIFYNSKVYPKCPINSWWDLTKPEWRGRIAMVDPVNDASSLDLITTIVLNADDLARDYQRVFGRPIHLTTPNAGYELLKGIIANKPRIYSRHTDLINVVGDPTNKNPPIGISIPFSSLGYAEDPARGSLKLMATTNITPLWGYYSQPYEHHMGSASNAAKLLIKYLFGDQYGDLA